MFTFRYTMRGIVRDIAVIWLKKVTPQVSQRDFVLKCKLFAVDDNASNSIVITAYTACFALSPSPGLRDISCG
ncbi:hypothetical protein HMPREF2943_09125 [Corynebacterium sp. HMSC072D12]|nr:hypothetical protein HMPREF2943_09125 [Corynebacterium sp. HMSC072D12]OFS41386.1 hypothetical protein HMPREF2896_01030 [Corynebacterium sp. HMSC069E04]